MNDLRYASRLLRRDLGYPAVAILTLAAGIGAMTTLFSVVALDSIGLVVALASVVPAMARGAHRSARRVAGGVDRHPIRPRQPARA